MNEPNKVALCQLTKPHGIRGALVARTESEAIEALKAGETVEVRLADGSTRQETLQSIRPNGDHWVLTLEGLADRDEAERYRGAEVLVPFSWLPELEDSHYFAELVGIAVETEEGEALGTVYDILETGAHDVLQVRDKGGNEVLIPYADAFVSSVDTNAGKIVVRLLEGMRDAH